MASIKTLQKAVASAFVLYGIAEILDLTSIKAVLDTAGRVTVVVQFASLVWGQIKDHPFGVLLLAAGLFLFFKDFSPQRTGLEARAFRELEIEFENLFWTRKLAVKLICEGIRDETKLSHQMNLMGFGPTQGVLDNIIISLCGSNLLEYKEDGTTRPNPVHLKEVDEIVTKWDMAIKPRP